MSLRPNTLTPTQIAEITARLGRAPTLAPASTAFTAATDMDWNRFTPRIALRYEIVDGTSVYALWSRGYKSGGFFGTPATALAAVTGFNPETVDNREIGLRTRLAGGRVQINFSAFDMKFQDLQIQDRFFIVPGDATTLVNQITNAAEARVKGLEADFRIVPVRNLTLSGSFGLLDTKITRVNSGSNLVVGAPLPKSPESTFNLAAEYRVPVGSESALGLRVAWHYEGENYLDINRRPAGFQDSFSTLDASVRLEARNWTATLWAKNLTDTLYMNVANLFPNGAAGPVQYGEPRTYGLTISRRF